MPRTTVTAEYQVTIPKDVRERAGLKPCAKLDVTAARHVIRLVRVPTLERLRGIARGQRQRPARQAGPPLTHLPSTHTELDHAACPFDRLTLR
ncbi:AbrB/MazE/SpoVT family DNA-binding domain-containing protein [bacterium]|nr:AbrB/MazE/SpoVT family DNA-binding domain-containing protein [bacterium]